MIQRDARVDEPQQETLTWQWQGQTIEVGVTRQGRGPTVLLLPALSTISTRFELAALQARLAERFQTIAIDWPGFGDRPRPFVDWNAGILVQFLRHVLDEVVFMPEAIIAAGHGAGLVLKHLKEQGSAAARLVLIAPTWRGPLPTALGERKPWFGHVRYWIDRPLLGQVAYRLNVSNLMLKRMTTGHVYTDASWLTGERLHAKRRITRTAGARHASVRFVTGGLDPFKDRTSFVEALRGKAVETLLIVTESMPPRSRAEMNALAKLPDVETVRLPRGKLGVHEEYPDDVAKEILAWWERA